MKQEYKKWACGPYYPHCDCCRRDSKKKCRVAVNRHQRRKLKKELRKEVEP